MKNTLLIILFLVLIFTAVFISLFLLRSFVYLLINYHTGSGIVFSLVEKNAVYLIKDIFPFTIIISICIIFIRMYAKAGNFWISSILIFMISAVLWIGGFHILEQNMPKTEQSYQVSRLFPGYIHDTESERIYIHEIDDASLISTVHASIQTDVGLSYLQFKTSVDSFSTSPKNPTFSPIIEVSPLFSSILQEFTLFTGELNRLYRNERTIFLIFTFIILSFFIFSGIIIRISKFHLFIVVILLVLVRFFFYLFSLFTTGVPAQFVELIAGETVYPPLIGIGYFSLLLFLANCRYSLVHFRRRSIVHQ